MIFRKKAGNTPGFPGVFPVVDKVFWTLPMEFLALIVSGKTRGKVW